MSHDFQGDIDSISRISAVPTILEVVSRTTGMRFAAIARVTKDRWVTCSVLDEIDFGLKPGDELKVETTICHEIRQREELVVIDHVAEDSIWRLHPTPAMYGFQSYISVPIILADGAFFGTLCAIDPLPARLKTPDVIGMFRLFAELVAKHLDAQKKLSETESALSLARSVIESNTDCISVFDLDGRLLSMNKNGCRLMEIDDLPSVLSKQWIDFWDSAEHPKANEAFQSALNGGEARFSGFSRTAKGQRKSWEVIVSPIVGAGGKTSHILSIARDVTARGVEEAQMRETARLESLGVLAGGIAHDFNNLLTGVLGNASILQMSGNPEDAEAAGEIVEAAERAADLTRQMLAYSGKGRFVVKRINLSTTTREILRLIRSTIDKKVEIVLSLDENLPLIEADPGQMQQLIMNLIINGSEAMEGREGKVFVSTAAIDVDTAFNARTFRSGESTLVAGRYVAVEVHDTGCGMSEDTLSRMFDPFFTTKFTGRGLGLAAVSGIVRGHGGAVRVYSQVGHGATCKVFFPVAETLRNAVAAPAVPHLAAVSGWGNILLVDDEEAVRRLGKIALERIGYNVLLAENGRLAIDVFEEHSRNLRLVILDLTMPVMSGDEALSQLREIDPNIPILLSSGYNQVEIIRRFTPSQVNGFIQKPYTVTQLGAAVAKVLER